MLDDFQGKGSANRLRPNKKCRKCGKKGAYYLGSDVDHGNILTPAADTEVTHYFECADEKCGHQWQEYA